MQFLFTHNIGLKILSLFLAVLIWAMIHHRLQAPGAQTLDAPTRMEQIP